MQSETNHGEREERGAEGTEGGVLGWMLSWMLVMPLPTIFFSIFDLKMASFGAFLELILLQLNCLSYAHKPVSLDFGL